MVSFNYCMHEAENGGPIDKDFAVLVEADISILHNIK